MRQIMHRVADNNGGTDFSSCPRALAVRFGSQAQKGLKWPLPDLVFSKYQYRSQRAQGELSTISYAVCAAYSWSCALVSAWLASNGACHFRARKDGDQQRSASATACIHIWQASTHLYVWVWPGCRHFANVIHRSALLRELRPDAAQLNAI